MRVVVIGASSGLGRCIALGLAGEGAQVAIMGRRMARLERAAAEAGDLAVPVACDVTDQSSVRQAIAEAADAMGGIDGLVYAAGIGELVRLVDTDAECWRRMFDTNVTGAALATAAAVPHLTESSGTAVYLTSVSASQSPPWPGLGAYAVSKAALDKMVEAWRNEHPEIGFTRLIVGECAGGPGESMVGFNEDWDHELLAEMATTWIQRNYMTGALMDVSQLIAVVDRILQSDPTVCMPTVAVTPRLITPDSMPLRPT